MMCVKSLEHLMGFVNIIYGYNTTPLVNKPFINSNKGIRAHFAAVEFFGGYLWIQICIQFKLSICLILPELQPKTFTFNSPSFPIFLYFDFSIGNIFPSLKQTFLLKRGKIFSNKVSNFLLYIFSQCQGKLNHYAI